MAKDLGQLIDDQVLALKITLDAAAKACGYSLASGRGGVTGEAYPICCISASAPPGRLNASGSYFAPPQPEQPRPLGDKSSSA